MTLKKIETFSRYQEIAEQYGKKGCASNDYIQREAADLITRERLYAYCGESNAFMLVRKDGFWRVYYYINDFDEIMDFGTEELVSELLFRGNLGEPAAEVTYLERCGFKRNLVRDQYFAKYASLMAPMSAHELEIETAKDEDDARWAIDLFNQSFDKWSGDYISPDSSKQLVADGGIIIAKDKNGSRLGALHLESRLGVTWLNHVAVLESARGKGVGMGLVDAYIEKGHSDENSRYMLWVQRQNTAAVSLYVRKGFTYMNKSTLSLIRK